MRGFRRRLGHAARAAAVVAILIWSVFPFWWAVVSSLKRPIDGFDAAVIPFAQFHPTRSHWRAEWANLFNSDGLGYALIGGMAVALGVVAVCLLLGLPAAVGLLRMRRTGGPATRTLGLILAPRLLPPILLALPFFLLGRAFGLYDTRIWLVMNQSILALPFAAVILQEAVRMTPRDLVDAAQLDGASWARITVGILPPMIAPSLVAAAAIAFAISWDEYLFAVMNHAQRAFTPPVAIMLLDNRDGIPFADVGSHLALVLLPPALLTLAVQRFLARGVAAGAVHGQ